MTAIDPYERRNVIVVGTPGKNEGLYARRNFSDEEIVAYYSGHIINITEFPITYSNMSDAT